MDDDIKRLSQETCLSLIPQFYDGVLEATRIQQIHDAIIEPFSAAIMRIHRNAYIQTMDADALAEMESGLGIEPSGTIEQRRQVVVDSLCDQYIVNDATLHEICAALAPGFTVYERPDPQALKLGVFTEEDAQDGTLPAVGIVDEIRPTVPQNLALYAGVETAFDRPIVISHAHFSALWAGLGVVERHIPNIAVRGGQIGEESETVYTSEKWQPNMVGTMSMGFGMMAKEVETTATPGMSLGDLQLGSGGLITGALQMGGVIEADSNT